MAQINFGKPFVVRNDFGKKVLYFVYGEHVFHGTQKIYLNREFESFELSLFRIARDYKNGEPLPFGYSIYNVEVCQKCGALLTTEESCKRKMGRFCYEH